MLNWPGGFLRGCEMTVGELICELEKYDRKLLVEFIDSWDELASIQLVSVSDDGGYVILAGEK
jgi:hypothetical protein